MTLLDAIAEHDFDAAFGGARRDEERARAKERVFSFRDDFGQWDPKSQRPELWNLYNGRIHKGEHVRVFPLSNWTELDVWEYIDQEQLEVPSIYFAHEREVFRRDGMLYAWRDGRRADRRRGGLHRDGALPHGRRHELHRRRRLARAARSRRSSSRSPRRGSPSAARRAPTTASRRPRWRTARRPGTSDARARPRARSTMTLDLLRFTTAGSVDDGKSTLIGRLLYDTKQVFEDQLEHVAQASERRGGEGALDLALLTDGLRAEREQGITIDVAYRYFATARRRFIIADCPGHQQYTRNMVTGASTADLSVVLLDARRGVLEQSKRHAFISALLGIPEMVVAVNKMDLVDHSQERFEELVEEFGGLRREAQRRARRHLATSRCRRSTATTSSSARARMDWYEGPVLLELLEQVEVAYDHPDDRPARFPVQWVIRPSGAAGSDGDYRGYAGQLASGALRRGDEVEVLPSGGRTRIAAIDTYDGELEEAMAPMSLTLRLEDELDISRGELICHPDEAPVGRARAGGRRLLDDRRAAAPGSRYVLKHTSRHATAIVDGIDDVVDVHTLERAEPPAELALNDIGRVHLRTSAPLAFDPYTSNRRTGSFILIDEASNGTVGAGMIAAAALLSASRSHSVRRRGIAPPPAVLRTIVQSSARPTGPASSLHDLELSDRRRAGLAARWKCERTCAMNRVRRLICVASGRRRCWPVQQRPRRPPSTPLRERQNRQRHQRVHRTRRTRARRSAPP